ncbi:hypothetical protein AB3Y40_06725 [Yoonia sp. R2331]|uniref:hypothetical protein n=1 Tax=Yoonia sp. R2331 TaxID=3237238 RepID=UPI0034E609CE
MEDLTQTWFPDDMDQNGYCADVECYETHRPSHSEILGPDGQPLEYEPFVVGFDLRRK